MTPDTQPDTDPTMRKGQPWEEWEDRLLLDESLSTEAIAEKTQRTPHSISERRRWVVRIGDIVRTNLRAERVQP
jgi:hypothetical protein